MPEPSQSMHPAEQALREFVRLQEAATNGEWRVYASLSAKGNTISVMLANTRRAVINWAGFDDSAIPVKEHLANATLATFARNTDAAQLALDEIAALRRERDEARTAQLDAPAVKAAIDEVRAIVAAELVAVRAELSEARQREGAMREVLDDAPVDFIGEHLAGYIDTNDDVQLDVAGWLNRRMAALAHPAPVPPAPSEAPTAPATEPTP